VATIIALANQKGGVGKTTTAINLAAYLAERGKFVLMFDMDPQANASSGLGIDYRSIPHGTYEALIGQKRVADIIAPTAHDGLRIAPATMALAGAGIELVNVDAREFKLREALSEVRNDYDYILIDCPPSLGLLTINSFVAADYVLIPVQAEYYALEGLGQLLQTISLVQEHLHPAISVLGAVITMYDSRNSLSSQVMMELYKYFPNTIFRSIIPRSVRLAEAPSHGKTILGYDASSRAAKAYERLADEFLHVMEQRLEHLYQGQTQPMSPSMSQQLPQFYQ